MIEPKRPSGSDAEAIWCQWAHDQIKSLRPMTVAGVKMGRTRRGDYMIEKPSFIPTYPPVIRVSDNLLHYLFDHYEMQNTVFDGVMVQTPWGKKTSGHYVRDFTDSDAPVWTIHLKVDVSGDWTLKVNKDSDDPFYLGTGPQLLGDYSGDVTNPVDPVTITKNIPWQIKTDDTFLAWARASSILLAGLGNTLGFTDPSPFTGGTGYGDWRFGAGTASSGMVVRHAALIGGGPSNWYLNLVQTVGSPFHPFEVDYTRNDGDGPVPYGTYSMMNLADPDGLGLTPPSSLTISAASDNAPS